jgi:glycosyltransferase involved in cell wall biosynthesis
MRVAVVAEPYVPIPPNKYGGIEQVIFYLIKGLKEAGHEPILLGPGDSTVDCEILPITPQALFFPKTKRELLTHTQLVKKARRKTRQYLKELLPDIDIIHSHGFDLTPFKDFPHVITLHNKITFDDPNYTTIDYLMSRKDLNYVTISNNQQAIAPELNYVGTVYNGEDPSKFPLVHEPENYVCFLGRFDRDKNPHLAIQLAINQGIKIKLGGKIDHDSEGYFDEEIRKYLDHPLVEFLGEVDFEQKIELLSKARCNLHRISASHSG